MIKKYKKSHLVINLILTFLFILLILNFFTLKITNYLFCILILLIPFVIIRAIYGYERKKRRYMYELMFYIFSFGLIILMIQYLSGIIVGFTHTIYKLDFNNFLYNVIPYLTLIIITEVFRYEIVRKGSGSITSYILITLILILIDMTLFLNVYNLSTGDNQIKYICAIILPSIFKNIVLLLFVKMAGPIPSVIYRILFDLKLVIFPIFPNFGLYFESIINCIIPVFMFGLIEISIKKDERTISKNIDVRKKFIYRYLLIIILVIITFSFNFLASGNFKYSMISIGSGSMSPQIKKGDVVIYKKIDTSDMPQVGEILVFRKNQKIVVHRIIKQVDIGNGQFIYYTKGDANDTPDGYPIEYKDIIGKVTFSIKYLGIPSVIIGEKVK